MDLETFARLAAGRVNVSPRRLVAPGPSLAQLDQLLMLAAAAPDHGEIGPWRFLLVPEDARGALGDAFALALRERDARATEDETRKARDKAFRAPLLLIAILRASGEPGAEIPAFERAVSFGAAIQNVLLGAEAMGYGAGLTSGKAMASRSVRELCNLGPHEHAVCCINIGTVTNARPPSETRRLPSEVMDVLRLARS